MTTVNIQQATLHDLDAIVGLFDAYRRFYEQPSDLEGARAFLFERLSYGQSVILLARDGEQAVGFTQLYPTFSSISMQRCWILNDLYVEPDYRGKQVGRALLEMARDYAVATGAKGLELSTAIENKKAQQLYETQGYVKDETYYHYFLKV